MATTRIMPLHVGKGRTESRAISDIIDYVANPQKTDNGRLIAGFACDSRTVDAEFLLAKRQYIVATGRVRGADDVIAYHVRQSFRPGEITPEEANRLGVEFAKRFTKGNHAFVVCTHIDKSHIHNHIIWSSVSLEYDRKFRNFWGSTKAVRQLSDTICVENGLSIVENPKPHGKCWGIRLANPIENPDANLPLGPYFLGTWLGDGISSAGAICLNDDDEPHMQPDILSSLGGSIRRGEVEHGAHTWFYDMDDGRILVTELKRLGLYMDKHIPAVYLRASKSQRLALLQGLMDTDGSVSSRGSCELCFTNQRLAETALELIRSLGIAAGMHSGRAGYTKDGERVEAGIRYRIRFTTSKPVFRLPRKLARLKTDTRSTQDWLYITSCEPTGRTEPVRCLNVATDDHLFLMGGFVPTHNSVTINDVTTLGIGTGAELYVIDHSTKATDYYWCRPWIADRGWGADSLLQTAGLLKWLLDDIEDGGERARAWKSHGWQNWYDDLSDEDKRRYPYRLIVVDELSQLTVGAKDATSLPKNPLPPVMEKMFEQQVKALILSTLIRILQIGRAYGYRVVVATQIASSTTGMPPALRGNLGNKVIMGAKVNDAQKNLIFNIAKDVPDIPANVIDEGVSKGAGLSEMEGQPPYDFKSSFPMLGHHAGVAALGKALAERIGLPDGIGMDEYLDSLDKDTPSNPEFEQRVMERIRFPEAESYLRFPFLQAIKDKWDESLDEYGGGPADAESGGNGDDGTAPAGRPVAPAASGPEPSGPLMDAAELARIMRRG